MYKKEDNIYIELNDCFLIKVQYKKEWINAYISKEDYLKVKTKHWRASHKKNKIYLVSGSKTKGVVYLHNFILNYKYVDGYEVDHIDCNSLNNRRENLRIVTRQENIENVSVRIDNKIGVRGVCRYKHKYQVDFRYRKKRYYFPYWNTIEEAVYCRWIAESYFGLHIIDNNPIAQQYLSDIDDINKEKIYNIVIEILRK